jgi:enoyl-CoA hydratase/carnithine racemase
VDEVALERVDRALVARLNRPRARNALDLALLDSLAEALAASAGDDGVSVLVLGTTQPGAFSAGMDRKEAAQPGERTSARLIDVLWALASYPKPSVAAVPGYVIGGGAELALAADIRIGDEATQFRFPGTRYGLAQGSWHLLDAVGASRARELVLTGRPVGADESLRLGLVHELSEDPETRALELAAELSERSAVAMAETKRLILEAGSKTLKERFDEEARVTEELMRGADVADRLGGSSR